MPARALSITSDVELLVEQLRRQVRERDAMIDAQRRAIHELRSALKSLKHDFALLEKEMERLLAGRRGQPLIEEGQGTLFGGPGTSEGSDPEIEAALEHASEAPDGETAEDPIKARHKPKRPARKLDASALPRERVDHELPEEERVCPRTGERLVPVGEKVTEELEYTPAVLKVVEHHRAVYGAPEEVAEERHVEEVVAPEPPRPLEGCKAGAGLLAQILVQKYMQHLPLYRQEEVFQQAGLWIPRQTLCDWVLRAAFELRPIAWALMREVRAGPVLQLDDTPVKCRGPKGSGHHLAYLWTFVNPEVEGVVYQFTPGRGAEHIEPFIEGLEGYLVGDGYSGHFAAAKAVAGSIVHGGCWAHALRKFREATKEGGEMARLFLGDIRSLYDIEQEATAAELDAEGRAALRREQARPVLARMLHRTRGWKETFSVSGKMGEAIKYLLNQWGALKCFLRDGRVPLDNNSCEQAIRPVALGRRNWLFAGSARGGEAAAIVYTLIGSCRRAEVDPWEYLRDVLVRVATHPAERVGELVPSRWAAAHRG